MASKKLQKVEVTNFPKKDFWDYINILATIIALVVAFTTLNLYIKELNKNPNLELNIHSGKYSQSDLFKNQYRFYVQLINRGEEISEIASLKITFSPEVVASFDYNTEYFSEDSHWNKDALVCPDTFIFNDKNIMVAKDTNKQVGTFNLQVPDTSDKILIAHFVLEGDFDRKFGVVYYENGIFSVEQKTLEDSTKQPFSVNIWNENMQNWKEKGIYQAKCK